MKKEFPEFYKLNDHQLATLGERAVFAFDASFLLDLYRYSQGVAKDMFSVLDGLADQVWLPYQAAYEFHSNRLMVLAGLLSKHSEVMECMDADGKKLLEKLDSACKKHPLLDSKQIVDPIRQAIEKACARLAAMTDKHTKTTLALDEDPIWTKITRVFAGRVGQEPTEEALKSLEQEARKRFDRKIPPGFADSKKEYPYGDYILWKQLLEHCKAKQLPGFFITSDVKHDWWLTVKGRKLGARPELRKEFLRYTGQEFHLYETTHFVEIYAPKFKVEPDEPIREIKKIRIDRIQDRSIDQQLQESFGVLGRRGLEADWERDQEDRAGLFGHNSSLRTRDHSGLLDAVTYHTGYSRDSVRSQLEKILEEQTIPAREANSASEFLRMAIESGLPSVRKKT